jgi:hypothetical protein
MLYYSIGEKGLKMHSQYITWRRKLELYADEIAALQAGLDELSQRMEAHQARLQKLSCAIGDDLQATGKLSLSNSRSRSLYLPINLQHR